MINRIKKVNNFQNNLQPAEIESYLTLARGSPPALGDRFWLPFRQKNPADPETWIHIETGQTGSSLPWARGQVTML